jgi:DNA-binding NtrC family response regulator
LTVPPNSLLAAPRSPLGTPIELLGRSALILRVRELVARAATLDTGVLIVGERGADLESIVREVHATSSRRDGAWVAVECGAADSTDLERAMFGASCGRAPADLESISADCHIRSARGGTLFLRDIAELPAAVQLRLARIARDGEARLDGEVTRTDIRLLASTSLSIDSDVREHRFRGDLYRRLAATRIDVPALRERPEDVAALAEQLLDDVCDAGGVGRRTFTQAALALIAALGWPGNLVELRGVVERIVAETRGEVIQIEQVLPALQLDRSAPAFYPAGSLREARRRFERDYIAAVLQHHGWRVSAAARTLGIQRPNLYRKARQLGIPVTRLT